MWSYSGPGHFTSGKEPCLPIVKHGIWRGESPAATGTLTTIRWSSSLQSVHCIHYTTQRFPLSIYNFAHILASRFLLVNVCVLSWNVCVLSWNVCIILKYVCIILKCVCIILKCVYYLEMFVHYLEMCVYYLEMCIILKCVCIILKEQRVNESVGGFIRIRTESRGWTVVKTVMNLRLHNRLEISWQRCGHYQLIKEHFLHTAT